MNAERHAKLFRNGRNQAVRIPVEFELPGDEVVMRKEGDRLIIESVKNDDLFAWLDTLDPIVDQFPDVDVGLLPPRDVEL